MADTPQVAENIATSPQQRSYRGSQFRFTPANAKQLAEKSRLSRLARLQREAQEKAELAKLAERGKELILASALQEKPAPAIEPEETYRLEQLARVRARIEVLWKQFEEAVGGKELQAIATAIQKLSDMEFALARRPKPAAYRTAPEKPKRVGQQSGPVDAD